MNRERQLKRQRYEWESDRMALGEYFERKKNKDIPENCRQIFFITYVRAHHDEYSVPIKLKTYCLNIYSDNSWMMQNDLVIKLSLNETFSIDTTRKLVGFFTTKQEALSLMEKIKRFFGQASIDNSFVAINEIAGTMKKEDEFWKQ